MMRRKSILFQGIVRTVRQISDRVQKRTIQIKDQ